MKKVRDLTESEVHMYSLISCVCGAKGAVQYHIDAEGKPVECPSCKRKGPELTVGLDIELEKETHKELNVWPGVASTC